MDPHMVLTIQLCPNWAKMILYIPSYTNQGKKLLRYNCILNGLKNVTSYYFSSGQRDISLYSVVYRVW